MMAGFLFAAVLASYLGFACLALAMPDHWLQVAGEDRQGHGRSGLRPAGCAMLVLAFVLCLLRDGPSFGSLLWVMMMGAAALAVALTLTWSPRLLLPLAMLWGHAAGVRH
ncbi:DUF3325 domain-containing protein [Massilia sp. SR12]